MHVSHPTIGPRTSVIFLVDRGRPELERVTEMRHSPSVVIEKLRRKFPLAFYLGVVVLTTLAATAIFLQWTQLVAGTWPVYLLALPVLVCASHLGVALANWLATQLLSPQSLPRMDFEAGIPPEHRTLVAAPCMLTSAAGIAHLLDGMEVRYLANRDDHLHFALVTDFIDAAAETLPGDADLVRLAHEGIERLNEKYARRARRPVLLAASFSPLERAGGRLDGDRTQTWKARGLEWTTPW